MRAFIKKLKTCLSVLRGDDLLSKLSVAEVDGFDYKDKYIERLQNEVDFLRSLLGVKDEHGVVLPQKTIEDYKDVRPHAGYTDFSTARAKLEKHFAAKARKDEEKD